MGYDDWKTETDLDEAARLGTIEPDADDFEDQDAEGDVDHEVAPEDTVNTNEEDT